MIKGACYHMNCVLQGNQNDEALKSSVTRKYHESFLVGVKGATSLLTFPSEEVANHGLFTGTQPCTFLSVSSKAAFIL